MLKANKAFTLIELLVVIAIIAILAAILFPVFTQAKAAAKKTASLSNTKNIGMGVQLYLADSDDILPQCQYYEQGRLWNGQWDEQTTWLDMLNPYIKNGNTVRATRVNRERSEGIWRAPGDPSNQPPSSYAVHFDLARDGAAPWNAVPYQPNADFRTFSTTQIEGVADKIYLLERGVNKGAGNWLQFTPWEWDWVDWVDFDRATWTPRRGPGVHVSLQAGKGDCDYSFVPGDFGPSFDGSSWAACGMLPRYRYNRSTPVVFLDGHAKSYNRTQNSTQIDWFKNIYIREASVFDESWYPY